MEIIYNRSFIKDYNKLNNKQKIKVDYIIDIFKINPYNYIIKNHKLNGNLKDMRSIYVFNDLRIIFRNIQNYDIR